MYPYQEFAVLKFSRENEPDRRSHDEIVGADRVELIDAGELRRDQRDEQVLEQVGEDQRGRNARCRGANQDDREQHAERDGDRLAGEVKHHRERR